MGNNKRNEALENCLEPVRAAIQRWESSPVGKRLTLPWRQKLLGQLSRIAEAWGGECLSDEYLGIQHHHEFRCKEGHVWQRTPATLLQGYFCPVCENRQTKTLQRLKAWAALRGWVCLSDEFLERKTPMTWRCDKGHEWTSTSSCIKQLKGCPVCYRERRYHTLATMQALARERGGECLSPSYKNVNHKLIWSCHRGHLWMTQPYKIILGHWCPQCAILNRIHKPGSKARRKYLPTAV
jgi:hypothetical protein